MKIKLKPLYRISFLISAAMVAGCTSAPQSRQAYFDAASTADYRWQQTMYHTTAFYGCGDSNFPCEVNTSLRINQQPVRSWNEIDIK